MTKLTLTAAQAVGRLAAIYARLMGPGLALAAFLAIFALSAVAFQLRSDIPPWQDGSPSDILNGVLIWMVSAIALVVALASRHDPVRSLMWFAGSAALGAVALDELFSIHEFASKIRDDDDPKILMGLGAGLALYVLVRVQRIAGTPLLLLVAGFAFHCAYLLSDLGDGDFFTIPQFGERSLQLIEELLEFTAMSFYFAAFVLFAVKEFARSPTS